MNPINIKNVPFTLGLPCKYKINDKKRLDIEVLKDQDSKWKQYATMYSANVINCLTQRFGKKHPFYDELGLKGHNGMDFKAFNNSFLYAIADGVVTGWSQSWGGLKIQTKEYNINGQDIKFQIVYGHLDSAMVTIGDEVKRGDEIGFTDNRGQYTTGPHLHVDFCPYYKTSRGGWAKDASNGYGGAIDFESLFDEDLNIKYIQPMRYLETLREIVDEYISSGGVLGVNEKNFKKIQDGDEKLKKRIKDDYNGMFMRVEHNGEFYSLNE